MLDTLANDVREHLCWASTVLAELRPSRGPDAASKKSPR